MITTIRISKDSYSEKLFGRFSCACGFVYSRTGPDERPEDRYTFSRIFAYGEILDSKLHEWWTDPTIKKKEIAQRIGITLTTLKKQAIRLGLLAPPKAKQGNKPEVPPPLPRCEEVERYRQEWLALLIAYPDASRGRLQRLLPWVHMWLKYHDQAWLKQHLPPPRTRTQRVKKQSALPTKDLTILPSYRRDPDDAELATMVRTTGQQFLASSVRPKRITKDFFQKTIPALAVLRNGKDRFPLTMLAINEYTETPEQAGLRRIIWATGCYLKEQVCPSRGAFEKYAGVASMKALPSIDRAVEEALQTLEALQGHGLALAQA